MNQAPISATNPLIISCVFGPLFKTLYPAIPGRHCVFFSNNPELAPEAAQKGWDFRLVQRHRLTTDYRVSSMQAKYIKFLQFFDEFPEFQEAGTILYFDHKFRVQSAHVAYLTATMRDDKDVLIRHTPRLKTSLHDEIHDAMGQARYAVAMRQTVRWIEQMLTQPGYRLNNQIMNTGLILYRNINNIMPLLKATYDTVWTLGQPECQIIWALLSQPYEAHIQRLEWSELDMLWQAPG
jgi:hypothetical protein